MSAALNVSIVAGFVLSLGLMAGCRGVPTKRERQARHELGIVTDAYRSGSARAVAPLNAHSTLSDFLSAAIFNHPEVEAFYFDWAASVERITIERSLPDPRLTFEADVAGMVMALMPGLMVDLPGPGKLKWQAEAAAAESRARYFAFESAVLQVTYDVKRVYYQMRFLEEKLGVHEETLLLLSDIERIASVQSAAGKVTLQDVLRAQIEQERLTTEVTNLKDSRVFLQAKWKAALGLKDAEPDPPWPERFEASVFGSVSDEHLTRAIDRNPRLQAMKAEVQQAQAALHLAHRARVPDVGIGIMADVRAAPIMWSPEIAVTLPIWRDKIAAQIAAEQATKRAATSRLSAEEIIVAVEFAEKSFMFREADRNLALLQDHLLPKARQSLDVARTAYISGRTDFLDFIEAERMLLEFQLAQVEARTQRELLAAEISLLIVGTAPEGAPLLKPGTHRVPGPGRQSGLP